MTLLFRISFFALLISSQLFSAETAVPVNLFVSLLPENPIIVEAGAQYGEDTAWMSHLWPKGTLYAFEPSPESFPSLEKIAKERSNIFTFQMALSDANCEMPFYLAGGASSLLPPEDSYNEDYFHVDTNNPIMVQVVTLDDWLSENNLPNIDFLWLDMEGNELKALQGAANNLPGVTLIYTEVNLQRFWQGCVLYEELKSWLATEGFTEIWREIIPDWQGNALFLNRRKLPGQPDNFNP